MRGVHAGDFALARGRSGPRNDGRPEAQPGVRPNRHSLPVRAQKLREAGDAEAASSTSQKATSQNQRVSRWHGGPFSGEATKTKRLGGSPVRFGARNEVKANTAVPERARCGPRPTTAESSKDYSWATG